MTSDSKDFSMHLSYELIRSFGEPYQSSMMTVRRFARKNLRIYVNYERERDNVGITGLVAIGGVTLRPNEALAFIKDVNQIPFARPFIIETTGKNLTLFPRIALTLLFEGFSRDQRIPLIIKDVEKTFSDLEKIEKIMNKYKAKEVGYPEVERIWKETRKTSDPNRKGKLLEKLFIQLIQIDGSFVLYEHNVKTKSEEIDIVIQPGTISPFWSRVSSPLILLECKNWKDKVRAKDVRDFAGKIENRPRLLCRIGFLIALSGFTKGAREELLGYRARDFVLATITGSQVQDLIQSKAKISDLLQKRLIDAGFR